MPSFIKVVTLDELERINSPAHMREQWRISTIKTQEYYLEMLISDHFLHSSPNKYYKPNTMKYEAWKKRYYPTAIHQLVLTGRLQHAVESGKVNSNGSITFNLPEYGLYQIVAGRDFLSPTIADTNKLSKRFTKEFFTLRSKYITSNR